MYHIRAIPCFTRKCSVRGYPGPRRLAPAGGVWQGEFGVGKRVDLAA